MRPGHRQPAGGALPAADELRAVQGIDADAHRPAGGRALAGAQLLPVLAAFPEAPRCLVAYSGGLDSEVLLHAVAALRDRLAPRVVAVHVDHGLHPQASQWILHCRARCERLGVPLVLRRVVVPRTRGESLEAQAREARYRALGEVLGPGELLLTAHHRDDQVETLLLALLRGGGLRGLAAMPAVAPFAGGHLVRPLLDYDRGMLHAYAVREGLTWVDDPSNADLAFDRNYLRHRVLPVMAERWPACRETLARSARHCAEGAALIADQALRAMEGVAGSRPRTLSISGLCGLEYGLRKAVIRAWIGGLGLGMPGARQLGRILEEVIPARGDASPLVGWRGAEVRRSGDDLFAMVPLPPGPGDQLLSWRKGCLLLPPELGRLWLTDGGGQVLDPEGLVPGGLSVGFGLVGCWCRPLGLGHRRPLKKLYQARGVPAWLRGYCPLILGDGRLLAVGDLWLCEGDRGFRVRWEGRPGEGGWGEMGAKARP